MDVLLQESKFWKHEESKKLEEDLLRSKESDLEMAARAYKAKTGVGAGFGERNKWRRNSVGDGRNKLAHRCS